MDKRKVTFELSNVIVISVGPLKDEKSFDGILLIVEEEHDVAIEWIPIKLNTSDGKSASPDLEWEEVPSSVGYKANHNESLDAVEIKSVRLPNVVKFELADLKSYKRIDLLDTHKTIITFLLRDGTNVSSFHFETSDFGKLLAALDHYINFKRSSKESNLFLVVTPSIEKVELQKSFSQLNLFTDKDAHIISNIIKDPYHTAMGGFSKVTNFLYDCLIYNPVKAGVSNFDSDLSVMLLGSLNVDIDNQKEPGFEVITKRELSPRPEVAREGPITSEEWTLFMDSEGRIKDFDEFKRQVFRGGLTHSIRAEAWKFLLGFYDPSTTFKEREFIKQKKSDDYFRMKLQWKTITADQESRFSALRDRKSLIEKDVSRTDRTHPFFEGENNPNLQLLQDILMTYCMYNFDLGYVQGMSDLLSPILVVMQNEQEAFWCFAGWLKEIGSNFEMEQLGMKKQLQDLHRLLHFVDNSLCNYLEKHDSGNMYFAFRWLLILFKRDFKFMEIMRLWEVLWTGLPCNNFHLLICLAILDSEKLIIMENKYGLTEILKHVNEMSYKIHLENTLCKAEAIYLQIKNSKYRSDVVETILGLEHLPKERFPGYAVRDSPSSDTVPNNLSEHNDSIEEFVDLEPNGLFSIPF